MDLGSPCYEIFV